MRLLRATSTRRDSIKTIRDAFNVSKLQSFARATWGRAPRQIFVMNQIHGVRVRPVRGLTPFRKYIATDALMSNIPDTMLVVKTADCVPVILYDPRQQVVAAIHSGWRGTRSRIVQKTIRAMGTRFGVRPGDVAAWMGPAICRRCYEVSPQRARSFRRIFPAAVSEHNRLDLKRAIASDCINTGVKSTAIHTSSICTVCSTPAQHYSFRKNEKNRVFVSAVMLAS